MTVKTLVYLDYQSTTPLDSRVLDEMLPYFTERFGNPHSVTHRYGWEAESAVDLARERVAGLIGADPKAVIFTSGATESNNLAIKGAMEALGSRKPHLIVPATEHKCVLESARDMARRGCRLTELPVKSDGLIDLNRLEDALEDDTGLVSVMAVNNEIGVIQPLSDIGAMCRARGIWFHCDAAQAFGKIPLDVDAMKIDLLSISGHKIYGPKGVGALFVRRSRPRVRLVEQMSGGGQENGLRSGTLSPPLCAGLGEAARIAGDEMTDEAARTERLMAHFMERLWSALPELVLNGHATARWAGNLNICFPGLDGEMLLSELRDLALSSGAACASATSGPSYVLEAIGRSRAEAQSALRIGIGRFTTREEVDFAADRLLDAVAKLGGLKPAREHA